MGADGGSIPDRTDLVKTKARTVQTDKAYLRELFLFCALSKRILSKPVVIDPLGKLYNKDALIEYFLDKSKYGDGDQICGYLKGVKDVLTLNLTDNPEYSPPASSTTVSAPLKAPFVCPLSLKEMNGAVPFIALRPCGCVFSDASIRAVIPNLTRGVGKSQNNLDDRPDEAKPVVSTSSSSNMVTCPNCGKDLDPTLSTSILPINPSKEVQEILLEQLLIARASAKASKKRKAVNHDVDVPVKSVKTSAAIVAAPLSPKNGADRTEKERPKSGKPAVPSVVAHNTLNRSVHQKLAEVEAKRLAGQAGMSDAVKAMFRPKEEAKKGGAQDFFGRTFNRYA
ncbi:Rtf2 RING-finger-domain-containing protein [Kockovaella imperatae]|uniref:Rtf2 RING-finger-domain-containing protein n=1 Tax=Kockovaella imperatae TaxID=4999 RepID=A0A1Y1UCI4_9TREE|nr:Rtf2 RING-finger-domain-containing protein [Kockovaella imperatae]ORX35712.1 Rtf2 RING-finger-domain-containing protein [Kockovaella imperatae]